MKKFLLLSNYAPKRNFKYPEVNCPLAHREQAHARLHALERFWPEGVLWQTVEAESTPASDLLALPHDESFDAIWLSGSPFLLHEQDEHPWIETMIQVSQKWLTQTHTPVVGICFGLQLLAQADGGVITFTDQYYRGEVDIVDSAGQKLVRSRTYHENYVSRLPPAAQVLGTSEHDLPYLVQLRPNVWGIQSHPECGLKNLAEAKAAEKFWQDFFTRCIDN